MKLLVVSICKNEAPTIGRVLDGIPKNISGITTIEKWVIDDGSDDDTAKIAKEHGAEVLSDGAGKRLAVRFSEAVELALSRGADVMVNIDGDMQFDPGDIPVLAAPVINGRADFAAADRFTDSKTGKRRKPGGMPPGKYWANRLGAWVMGALSEYRFRDVTCGFRAYNRDALFALNLNGKYTYTQESFQVLAKKRKRIVSVPIKVTYFAGRKSRVVTNFGQFLFGSALSILRAFRDFAPLRFFVYLGTIPFVLGFILVSIVGAHWLTTGRTSPLQFMGFTGLYLLSLGIIIWIVGIVADTLDRVLNNQEKILEGLKRSAYNEKKR